MGESTPSAERLAHRAKVRAAMLRLLVGVVAVHGLFLLLYYAFHVADTPTRTQTIFVATWTFATALTVAFLLREVRALRRVSAGRN